MNYSYKGIKITADSKEDAINVFNKSKAFLKQIEEAFKELSVVKSAKLDSDYRGEGKVIKFIREFKTSKNEAGAEVAIRFEGSFEADNSKSAIEVKVKINNQVISFNTLSGKELNKKSLDELLGSIFAFVIGFERLG